MKDEKTESDIEIKSPKREKEKELGV